VSTGRDLNLLDILNMQ